ncbi:MAG: hypothetical protein CND00_00100 [Cryomorphaceae bacterium MED-G14]|nr:MAG: hypothetical protein CND00_00100 [Cryomorphaceae bacterium MED-G14]|tara:strand:- start:334 stop:627 length:294 start_codon:yes stop_codon:yes gene_type:complete
MNKSHVFFLIQKNTKLQDLKDFFVLNYDNNCIIQFETDYDHDHIFLKEIQNNNSKHKKSIVLISKNLTLDNFNNITPTLQEALDIIEIEEIERSLNI